MYKKRLNFEDRRKKEVEKENIHYNRMELKIEIINQLINQKIYLLKLCEKTRKMTNLYQNKKFCQSKKEDISKAIKRINKLQKKLS